MDAKNELKLDKKDKKILSILELDSRTPASVIGKRIGLSKSSVIVRIKALEESGIVLKFMLGANYGAVGTNYRLYLKFENAPDGFEKELVRYLYTSGFARWFTLAQGEWDIIISTMAKSIDEFRQYERSIMAQFGKYVEKRAFAVNVRPTMHFSTHLTGNEGSYLRDITSYRGGLLQLSPADYRVLFWLYENSRMPVKEIAEKTGLSPEVVSYHMKKLEKAKAFFKYTVRFDRNRLGYSGYKAFISLRHSDQARLQEFLAYCDSHPNVSFFSEILGPWDFEIDLDAKSSLELYKMLRQLRTKFADIVRDVSTVSKIREFEPNPFGSFAGMKPKAKEALEVDI